MNTLYEVESKFIKNCVSSPVAGVVPSYLAVGGEKFDVFNDTVQSWIESMVKADVKTLPEPFVRAVA